MDEIKDKDKKINHLENLLEFAKDKIQENSKKVIFAYSHNAINEACHVFIENKDGGFSFYVRSTMDYKHTEIKDWKEKNFFTAKGALESAKRYFPNDYDKFVEEVRFED